MSVTVATATPETFEPLVGAPLALTLPSGAAVSGSLVSVSRTKGGLPGGRVPFSLILDAPLDEPAGHPAQGIMTIAHEAVGSLELFAVPIKQMGTTIRWQIVFG